MSDDVDGETVSQSASVSYVSTPVSEGAASEDMALMLDSYFSS